MNYKAWAEKIINDHKHPIVKFDRRKGKLFLPLNTIEEEELLLNQIITLRKILNAERSDKRSGRCRGEWLSDEKLIKFDKLVGSKFHNMGYQNKQGRYVFPEEALFLIETNRAEVIYKTIPMSIEQAYGMFLSGDGDLAKYKAYRKLSLRGYDVIRVYVAEKKIIKSEQPKTKKIKINKQAVSCKKTMREVVVKTAPISDKFAKNQVDYGLIFQNLQKRGPQMDHSTIDKVCNYKVNVGGLDNVEYKYDLHFMDENVLDPKIGFYTQNSTNIYCNVNNDNVIFTTFTAVTLPTLQ